MAQYSNFEKVMEARNHSKNEASAKRLKRISIIIIILAFIPFSYGISQENKVVINVGGSKFFGGPYASDIFRTSSPSFGLNVNAGLKTKFFENGVYYGYNQLRKFQLISREGNSTTFSKSLMYSDDMAGFNTFGAYSNFYITSLFKKKDFSTRIFNFYTTVKTGLYYVPAKDTDFTGAGFNCYIGIGTVFYPSERVGIFSEIGGDYFSYMDCELNRLLIRAGISIRL